MIYNFDFGNIVLAIRKYCLLLKNNGSINLFDCYNLILPIRVENGTLERHFTFLLSRKKIELLTNEILFSIQNMMSH